jgi:GNAT superfamily N-acetyltransferase
VTITFRAASDDDRLFIESVFFDAHRWLIEELFGWRGDDVERQKFAEAYDQANTSIVLVDGRPAGWLTVSRRLDEISLDEIFLSSAWQNQGIGTLLIGQLVDEARAAKVPLRLATAKINPAVRLYRRLGFLAVRESGFKTFMELS